MCIHVHVVRWMMCDVLEQHLMHTALLYSLLKLLNKYAERL